MKIRATLFSFATGVVLTAAACGSSPNKIMADTPVLPYEPPDVSEITGIDEDDEDEEVTEEASEEPADAPAPAPQPAAAQPAKPAAKAQAPAPAKK